MGLIKKMLDKVSQDYIDSLRVFVASGGVLIDISGDYIVTCTSWFNNGGLLEHITFSLPDFTMLYQNECDCVL